MTFGEDPHRVRTEQFGIRATAQPMETTFDMALLQEVLVAPDVEAPECSRVERAAPDISRIAGSGEFTCPLLPVRSRPRGRP